MANYELQVKGTKLRYVDHSGDTREQQGTDTGNNGTPYTLWIEGDNIHYIDHNGDERYLPYEEVVGSDTAYTFKVGNWIRYANSDGDLREWHTDTEDDHTDQSAYSAAGYSDDPAHNDIHTDVAHQDWLDHPDGAPHSNIPHTDVHTDTDYPHSDTHTDHTEHTDYGDWTDQAHIDYTDTYYQLYEYIDGTEGHTDQPEVV
jgi:hypothetical protein